MVTIQESGMTFGPFQEDQIYWIEKASAYKSLGQGIKSVEFVYKKNADKLFFIEAKSSSPKKERENFDEYIDDISEKFIYSFNLWLTLYLQRRKDNIAPDLLDASMKTNIFSFILVINGHKQDWLPPIKEALERKLMVERKIWNHKVIVINDSLAKTNGLIRES